MILRAARLSLLAWGLVLYGQDAGMVLRTSVTYNTQKSSPLSEEQRSRRTNWAGRHNRRARRAIRRSASGLLPGAGDHAPRLVDTGAGTGVVAAGSLPPMPWSSPEAGHGHPFAAVQHAAARRAFALTPRCFWGRGGQSLGSMWPSIRPRCPCASPSRCRKRRPAITSVEVRLSPSGDGPAFVKSLPIHVEALAEPCNDCAVGWRN